MNKRRVEGAPGVYLIEGLTGISDPDWAQFIESLKPDSREPSETDRIAITVATDYQENMKQAVKEQLAQAGVSHRCPAYECYSYTRAYWLLVDFLKAKGHNPDFRHGIEYSEGSYSNYFELNVDLTLASDIPVQNDHQAASELPPPRA